MLKQLYSQTLANSHKLKILLKPLLWLCSSSYKLRWESLTSNVYKDQAKHLWRVSKTDSKVKLMHFWLIPSMVSLVQTFSQFLKELPTQFMSRESHLMQLKERLLTFSDLSQDLSLFDWFLGTKMHSSNLIKPNPRLRLNCFNLSSTSLRTYNLQVILRLQLVRKKTELKQIKSSELCCVSQTSKIPCKLPFASTPYR